MDLAALTTRLANITSDDPVWKLRRAALHTEVGEYVKAAKLIKDATADLERRHRLDRNSLPIKSRLAWASWISRASTAWNLAGRAELTRPRDFKELDIDPLAEIDRIESRAAEIEKERREESAQVQPAFDAGHYRDGSGRVHIGHGEPSIILQYELDQLIEHAGLPLRINHVDVCAWAAIPAIEVAYQANVEWYVWLLRSLHSHSDRPFARHFGRVAIARMPAPVTWTLLSIVESAVAFWTRRFKDTRSPDLRDDSGRALDVLRLLLTTLSRLTVRMTPDQAADALRRAAEMAKDPQLAHFWLIEALGELAKYAAKAVPTAQQGALALTILEFPLPSEKGGRLPFWPRIVSEIWSAEPVRDPTDTRWDHRVHQLIAAAQKGQAGREYATLLLAYLALRDALRRGEVEAFGKALWSDVDAQENALPQNTGLSPSAFLQLPADDGIDVQARLRARLFDPDLRQVMTLPTPMGTAEMGGKVDHLYALAKATELGLTLPADTAVRMFDEIVVWEQQNIDRKDPFGASFLKGFNDNIRLAAGHVLTTAVVPAMRTDQRTQQRVQNLIAFITRTRSWTSIGALPYFLPSTAGVTGDVTSFIRMGLLGSEVRHVASAAEAIGGWAKLVRNGTLPELPRSLVEQLIATIEMCREVGLPALLGTARALLKDNFLLAEDFQRLTQTMLRIRREFRYEDVGLDTMEAVSVSLVRAECVKLAVALKDRVADDGTLQAWIDEAKIDPLPEVRFALTEA